jgi:hypothetical protein
MEVVAPPARGVFAGNQYRKKVFPKYFKFTVLTVDWTVILFSTRRHNPHLNGIVLCPLYLGRLEPDLTADGCAALPSCLLKSWKQYFWCWR